MPGPRRRDVLRLGAAAAASTAIAACTGGSGGSGGSGGATAPPRPSGGTTTGPAPTSAASAPDWARLADQLHGDLLAMKNRAMGL